MKRKKNLRRKRRNLRRKINKTFSGASHFSKTLAAWKRMSGRNMGSGMVQGFYPVDSIPDVVCDSSNNTSVDIESNQLNVSITYQSVPVLAISDPRI